MKKLLIATLCGFILVSCASKTEKQTDESNSSSNNSVYENNTPQNSDEETAEGITNNPTDCKFEDGTYSATVDYNNPETGYSATYTLDVEVQDCQIVQINFPNDGYLDDNHISYADIDDEGNALVYGENGKTYEVQIDY
jgi:hypothetical protein